MMTKKEIEKIEKSGLANLLKEVYRNDAAVGFRQCFATQAESLLMEYAPQYKMQSWNCNTCIIKNLKTLCKLYLEAKNFYENDTEDVPRETNNTEDVPRETKTEEKDVPRETKKRGRKPKNK